MRLLCQQGNVTHASQLTVALATKCNHRTSTMRSRVQAPPGEAPGTTGMGSGSAAAAWRVAGAALRPLSARSANAWSLQGADLQERSGQQGGQAGAVRAAAIWGSRPQATAYLEHIPRSQAFTAASDSSVHCCIKLIASAVRSLPTAQPHQAAPAHHFPQFALTVSAVRARSLYCLSNSPAPPSSSSSSSSSTSVCTHSVSSTAAPSLSSPTPVSGSVPAWLPSSSSSSSCKSHERSFLGNSRSPSTSPPSPPIQPSPTANTHAHTLLV